MRSGYPTPAFLGAQKSKREEDKNAMPPLHSWESPTPSGGEQNHQWSPKKRNKISSGCLTHAFSGIPKVNHGEQKHKWYPTRGNKIRTGCLTPAFLGITNSKRGEQNQNWFPGKGKKIRNGCLNPAFSEIPNAKRGEENQKWSPRKGNKSESLPHPCLVGGPKKSPEMPRQPCLPGDSQQRGTKSKMAT